MGKGSKYSGSWECGCMAVQMCSCIAVYVVCHSDMANRKLAADNNTNC